MPAFTAYAYASAGGSALRTTPTRLSDVYNVKDFGATGDGSTNDQPAIQAAINAAGAGVAFGTVYFPPGIYKVNSKLTVDPGAGIECGIKIVGQGRSSSSIVGSFSNPIFEIGKSGTLSGDAYNTSICAIVDGLDITNNSLNVASGCITLKGAAGSEVRNCKLTNGGGIGLRCYDETFANLVSNVLFNGYEAIDASAGSTYLNGSKGCLVGQHTTLIACDFKSYAVGMQCYGVQVAVLNTRIENCQIGFNIGDATPTGAANGCSAFTISGGSFEANITGIQLTSVSYGTIANMSLHGNSNNNTGGGYQMVDGVKFVSGGNINFTNVAVNGGHIAPKTVAYSGSDWKFVGLSGDTTLMSCGGATAGEVTTPWSYGTGQRFLTSIGTPVATLATTIAGLPANPSEGDRRIVTDCSTATAVFNAVAATGTGTVRVPVWYDAGTANWKVG